MNYFSSVARQAVPPGEPPNTAPPDKRFFSKKMFFQKNTFEEKQFSQNICFLEKKKFENKRSWKKKRFFPGETHFYRHPVRKQMHLRNTFYVRIEKKSICQIRFTFKSPKNRSVKYVLRSNPKKNRSVKYVLRFYPAKNTSAKYL